MSKLLIKLLIALAIIGTCGIIGIYLIQKKLDWEVESPGKMFEERKPRMNF